MITQNNMITKKNIIFDMDGVLIDSESFHFRVWQRMLHQQYGIWISFEEVESCVGSTGVLFLARITELYGIRFGEYEQVMSDYHALKMTMIEEEGLPRIEGVFETLELLHQKGYRMAVASSSKLEYIHFVLQTLKINRYFEVCCSGEDCEHTKPAPDVRI